MMKKQKCEWGFKMENRTKRITDKCLKIYDRKRTIYAVNKYLERLLPNDIALQSIIMVNHVIPVIRKKYFINLTIETFINESIQEYGKSRDPAIALTTIWDRLDELPFTPDEYTKIVDLIDEALSKEPNPPSKEDWEELNEWLMK